jgi:hypothetical protein
VVRVQNKVGVYLMGIFLGISLVQAGLWTADVNGDVKNDFSPAETVYIHGQGFSIASNVYLDITRPDSVTNSGTVKTDFVGNFIYQYLLDGITGTYYVYATDGIHEEETSFTDAAGAVWTTNGDCGDQTQDVNHFNIGDVVYINGAGFSAGTQSWSIKGNPGGASCDPNIIVADGIVDVNNTGAFCFNAYTIQNDDCGEYQVKVGNKGDNYNVEGGSCIDNSDCGLPSSQLICIGNNITNETTTPLCIAGVCQLNITIRTIETCELGCSNAECIQECSTDNDCPDDSYSGNYCFNDDIYHDLIDYSCINSSCISDDVPQKVEECGDDYCNNEVYFCNGDEIWKNQTCYDKGCFDGECYSNPSNQSVFVQFCPNGCKDAQCIGCIDKDKDCVCDKDDLCPNSRPGELIDENGCDPFQFCRPFYCGNSCYDADFIPKYQNCVPINSTPEPRYPADCTVVMVFKEGTLEPRCVPLTCAD